MKRVLKKFLVIILIILILNNFFMNPVHAYAIETVDDVVNILVGAVGILVAILTLPFRIVAIAAGYAVNILTAAVAFVDGATEGNDVSIFITPFDILFNKVKLFDINFFDILDDGSIVSQVRASVAAWYYTMRTIAAVILLVILIYVGVRMALSTVASDRAVYKRMLVDWAASLALIFVLQYIIIFAINVNNSIVNAISLLVNSEEISNVFHNIAGLAIPTELSLKALKAIISLDSLAATAIFCMLVGQVIGLVFAYLNRMIKVGFLIIIAPLISLTYSIDKMGDGKAQALDTWLKELVFSILLQPFHCAIYMCFVDAAFKILVEKSGAGGMSGDGGVLAASIVALLCVRFVKEAEKLVRKIFAFKDDDSSTSLKAGMAMSAIALSQAKNIGKTAKGTFNSAKNFGKNLKNLGTNAKIDALAMHAYMSAKDGEKDYAEYREDVAAKVYEEKANKKLGGDIKKFETYESENSDFKKLVDEETQKVRDLNPGMGDKQARAIARKNAADKIVKSRKNAPKNEKKRKKAEDRKKAAADARERREQTKHGRIINAVSDGTKYLKNSVKNSETLKVVKELSKDQALAGIGFMVGSAGYGTGKDIAQSIMEGAAVTSGLSEFMSGSRKTIAKGMRDNLKNLGVSDEKAVRETIKEVMNDSQKYDGSDKTQEEVKKLVNDVMRALQGGGIAHEDIRNQITTALSNDPLAAPDAIKDLLGDKFKDEDADKDAYNKLLAYSNKKAIYSQMMSADAANIRQSDMMETVGNMFGASSYDSESSAPPNEQVEVANITSDNYDEGRVYQESSAYSKDSINEEIERLQGEIDAADDLIQKSTGSVDDVQNVEELEVEKARYERQIKDLEEKKKSLDKDFDEFRKRIDEEISREYSTMSELGPGSDEYREAMRRVEKLKIAQATAVSRRLAHDKDYLERQGRNLARQYQAKLDEAIDILQQRFQDTHDTKYQVVVNELKTINSDLLTELTPKEGED